MTVKILDYKIYAESKNKLIDYIKNKEEKLQIVSGNPEVLYNGINNKELFSSFTSESSIIIPDGVGTLVCSKIARKKIEEKIAGIEVMEDILSFCEEEGKTVYLLGATQETLDSCIESLQLKYKALNIVGSHHGFFSLDNCDEIISHIIEKAPYAIFVAMGCPRQEIFITKYMDVLPCKIFMGVGGSFDVLAGNVKRAPKWMISLGLEWLYRVSREPWRIKRLSSIPKFILKVMWSELKIGKV